MAYFTPEQVENAKKIDVLTYLQNYNPEELVYDSRNAFHTRTHDSLKISNGMWYWFSRGIGGKTALEYLIQVEEYSFTDAVGHLLNQKGLEKRYIPKQEPTEKEKTKLFCLPEKAFNNNKVISYLTSRGISKTIIEECINKDFIYQDSKNNVVFVGYDEQNIAKYASLRGTNSKRYLGEVYGSDKAYSFKLSSILEKKEVHIFESAIDLLSYATLKELNNQQWDEENLLSLSGVYNTKKDIIDSKIPKTLITFLKNNPNIDTIILHLDNDIAGRKATKAIQYSFSDRYKVIDKMPQSAKDVNDVLKKYLNITIKNSYENYR